MPERAPRALGERRAGRCVPLHSILVVGAGGRRRLLPVHATIAIASLLRFAFGLVTALSQSRARPDASRAPSTSRSRLTAPSQIETERLTLRRRRPDDAGALGRCVQIPP
ncbi:hypothetical protein Bamb_4121 [Burkholderia ambifaria AMMD]|uniref:Uncharacterized protein n=1 Tax=Burkholderia ambifaria (strain ATCC BAA-244 / DSM 16087 / CCUG 44356 / LMG 19182 / AMMD) TaxID=339670 RepID=Q0B849_BURCM|nr:hypothetical protein Bamb_4121 [Burkholderia ambifaria AMMD]